MAGRSLAGAPVTAVASFESGARLRNADLVQPVTQPVTMTPNEHVSGRRLEPRLRSLDVEVAKRTVTATLSLGCHLWRYHREIDGPQTPT